MNRHEIESVLGSLILALLLNGWLIQATPQSYDLFQGSAYTGGGHRHLNKNWCARVVYKNVTCSVLGSAVSYLEPEPAPCPPHQPDCDQRMMYRTQFRPTYRIAYKTVTQLEWKCCPGFQGPDCAEPKASAIGQTVHRPRPYPQTHPIPGQTQHRFRPGARDTAPSDWGQGGDRVRRLEGEIDTLSQTVRDLQAAITGMNENLRLDIQEDTSKMLLTLLNTLHLPVSDLTAGSTERVHFLSHTHPVPEADTSAENPASPSQGRAPSSNGHTPSSEGHLTNSEEIPSSHDSAPSSLDNLHSYMERRIQDLREELLGQMRLKMAALQDSCDSGLQSLKKECEQQGVGFQSLASQLDRKEAGLREELHELRIQVGGTVRTLREANEIADLRREVGRVADAHQALNARMDNELEHLTALSIEDQFGPRLVDLEGRMNVTERNAETLCFYIEDKLSRRIANETDSMRSLFEERLGSTEDQFTAMLVEIASGNGSFPADDATEEVRREVKTHGLQILGLEAKLNALGKQCSTGGCQAGGGASGAGAFTDVLREVRLLGGELDTLRSDINGDSERLRELESLVQRQLLIGQHNSRNLADQQAGFLALRGDVGALQNSLGSLEASLTRQAERLRNLNSTCSQANGACMPGDREALAANGNQVDELRVRLEQLSREVKAELAKRRFEATVGGKVGGGGGSGDMSNSLQRVADTLNRHAASVWARVQQLQTAQRSQAHELSTLATSLHDVQAQLSGNARNIPGSSGQPVVPGVRESPVPAAESRPQPPPPGSPVASRPGGSRIPHIRVPLTPPQTPLQPSAPQEPHVMETGQAGPPGSAHRVGVRMSLLPESQSEPMQGYAGAPGYPLLNHVSLRPNVIPAAFVPRIQARSPLVTPVSAGGSAVSESFSFSAGLTTVPLPWTMGVIRFDKVLVNDGGHYNHRTGVFTAPQDGRYLISAVLTPQQGDRVEGALSVSDRSVQRLTSAGHAHGHEPRPCSCGGPASVSLILQLQRGDRVAVVKTAGRLAVSEPKEVLSTFSALFLYSAPNGR